MKEESLPGQGALYYYAVVGFFYVVSLKLKATPPLSPFAPLLQLSNTLQKKNLSRVTPLHHLINNSTRRLFPI